MCGDSGPTVMFGWRSEVSKALQIRFWGKQPPGERAKAWAQMPSTVFLGGGQAAGFPHSSPSLRAQQGRGARRLFTVFCTP